MGYIALASNMFSPTLFYTLHTHSIKSISTKTYYRKLEKYYVILFMKSCKLTVFYVFIARLLLQSTICLSLLYSYSEPNC